MSIRRRHVLPGFGLSLGITVSYLSLVVLIPLSALLWKTSEGGLEVLRITLQDERVIASLKLSFGASLVASLVSGLFGLLTAWALVRYRFPGKRIVDAMVDLPFALPTAVAGIALVTLYAPTGWIGEILEKWEIKAAFTPLGVSLALVFIGFPFVVRTLQPMLEDLSKDPEEASACLGASRWRTFRSVILPALFPSLLAGMTLAFGRAVGEYGSVVFISGNLPYKTEIAPLLIVSRLEQYDYSGATCIGLVMLTASFGILLVSHLLASWQARRAGH
jgi:sulfate transport system permease protein